MSKKSRLVIEKQFDDSIKQMKKLRKKVIEDLEKKDKDFRESDPTVDFRKEIKDRDKMIEKLNHAVEDSDKNIERLQAEILRLTNENKELSEKNAKLKEKCSKYKSDLEESSQKFEEYHKMYVDLELKYNTLESMHSFENERANNLQDQINKLSSIPSITESKEYKDLETKYDTNTTRTVNTLDFIFTVLTILYEYFNNPNYFDKASDMSESLEKIHAYQKDNEKFNDFKSFYNGMCDRIGDIQEIFNAMMRTLGYLDEEACSHKERIDCIEEVMDNKGIYSFVQYVDECSKIFKKQTHWRISRKINDNKK